MEIETTKRDELRSLIEAIKATEVLDSRVSLISQLESLYQSEKLDQSLLLDYLVTLWEELTCFDISEYILKKIILSIASKYLESDFSNFLSQYLILGLKASTWCGKHIQETLAIHERQDEAASSLFFQIVLESLGLSLSIICALTKIPVLREKVMMLTVENLILELLKLIKISVMEMKKIRAVASELLKVAQTLLDAIIKLCRAYFEHIKWDSFGMNIDRKEGPNNGTCVDYASHLVNIIARTIENLSELGMFAASGGGSLVIILNVSWKGVVSLLQLGKGVLAGKMNVGNIIGNLVSMAIESLRCASESWSMVLEETLSNSEAKRTFLPIKFYLINALRIASDYPFEAINLYREITHCILLISSLGVAFSKEAKLRAASEMLVELLEPTSILLLHTLLNKVNGECDMKVQILDWLYKDDLKLGSNAPYESADRFAKLPSLNSIFLVDCGAIAEAKSFMLGRVMLFLNLLKSSPALKEEVIIVISAKLGSFLHMLAHEDVYSSILGLQIPTLCNFGKNPGLTWQPMYSFVLHSWKVFMISTASSGLSWTEIGTFLLQNLFHPHPLCLEIVTELWCFLVRHAERDLVNYILGVLCSLLKSTVALSGPVLKPLSAVRKLSRQVCLILSFADPASVDRFYDSVLNNEKSNLSSTVLLALLMEGFPLDSLSDDYRKFATQKLISSFYAFMESNVKELALNCSSKFCECNLIGIPVHALSSALQHCKIKDPDMINDKNISLIVKFAVTLVKAYKSVTDGMKEQLTLLLGATLVIISNLKNVYGSDEMANLIMELRSLFMQSPSDPDELLHQCKTSLVFFLTGLSFMKIAECEGETLCTAIWDLYHMLLRERHWPLVHLVMIAFGYFAARTSCTQLWRFVPNDAALSFDTETGTEANEDRFMSELKGILEKEVALPDGTVPSQEQLTLLVSEGDALKDLVEQLSTVPQIPESQFMSSDDENRVKKKKRKFPDGLCEGVELLQNGLKIMSNALAQSNATEFRDAFLSHISCLEDTISLLIGLTDKG